MARAIHKLTARAAETISKPGRHSDDHSSGKPATHELKLQEKPSRQT
jgi:hypothetical protein